MIETPRTVPALAAPRVDILTVLLSVCLFVLTPAFFTPSRIYAGNFMEFESELRFCALFSLAVSAVLAGALLAAVLWLRRHPRASRVTVSVLLAAAFLMWLQGTFLVWGYGVLSGREIEWSSMARYGVIDSLIWAVVLAFAVLKADVVLRAARILGAALLAVQIASFVQAVISMPKNQDFKGRDYASDTLFRFSPHLNVVLIVLDTFPADLFQDIVRQDDGLRSCFDGFTYFRNSLAGSDATSVSIPNMLTARNYDNGIPYLDFVRQAFLDNSLPRVLGQYGFSVDLDPILSYSVYTDFSSVSLPRRRLLNWNKLVREEAFIADLSLFRSLPHFAKRLVYNRQKWMLSSLLPREADNPQPGSPAGPAARPYDLKYAREYMISGKPSNRNHDTNFLHRMVPRSDAANRADAFKFYHLNGMHLQLTMNEDLEDEYQLPTRAAMLRQGTGVLKIAAIILERLRQLKVYDDSLIFIVGDHGFGLSSALINPSPYGARFNRGGPYKGFFQNFKSAAIPLVLAKRIGARGPLRTSDAPVSLGDIPQTVASELRLDARFPGESMFSVKEAEDRERIYRAFLGPQEDVQYFAPLQEYSVRGFSWDDESWRETGTIYYPR